MVLTAQPIDAAEAYRIGLVNKVVASDSLAEEAQALAEQLAAKGPIALRFCKEAIIKGLDLTLEQGLRLEADLYFLLQTTDDRMEGIRAFFEKRTPQFKGR
jgi:enoyl-CoA hydratase/carnithine racemase